MKYRPSSFSEGKVIFGDGVVYKKQLPGSHEYFSAMQLDGILKNVCLENTRVQIARVVDFISNSENIMVFPFYQGDNMEELLDSNNDETRELMIRKIANLFRELLKKGFLILDFAPRNILYNGVYDEITILDFERGICNISGLNDSEIAFLFSFSIFEELSAFLSLEEINLYFININKIDLESINYSKILPILNSLGSNRRSRVQAYFEDNYPQLMEDKVGFIWVMNNEIARMISGEVGGGKMRIVKLESLGKDKILKNIISEVLKYFVSQNRIKPRDCLRVEDEFLVDDLLGNRYFSKKGKGFPRSGLDVYEYLISRFLFNREECPQTLLDIGTGEIGFLGNSLAKIFGKGRVIGVEIDQEAYDSALNNQNSDNFSVKKGNVFPEGLNDIDFIVSNPPQMPGYLSLLAHDSGGRDGLDIFEDILKGIKINGSSSGVTLVINLFDFLGVEESYGRERSVMSLLTQYDGKIVDQYKVIRRVRENGETDKNKCYILRLAPGFCFGEDEKGLYHYMYILTIKF